VIIRDKDILRNGSGVKNIGDKGVERGRASKPGFFDRQALNFFLSLTHIILA